MKYELKRSNNWLVLCGIFVVVGIFFMVTASGDIMRIDGTGLTLLSGVFFIRELFLKIRKLTFDSNSFFIGKKRYSYSDIESVESWRETIRSKGAKGATVHVKIIVDGKSVYKFDHTYKNVGKFVEQLTLHGVKHNLHNYIEIGKGWG